MIRRLALAAVLAAAAIGPAAAQPTEAQRAQFQAALEETVARLQLDAAQQEVVMPILLQGTQERVAIFQEFRASSEGTQPSMAELMALRDKMNASFGATRDALAPHLSETQLAAWDTLREERREQMRARFRAGDFSGQ